MDLVGDGEDIADLDAASPADQHDFVADHQARRGRPQRCQPVLGLGMHDDAAAHEDAAGQVRRHLHRRGGRADHDVVDPAGPRRAVGLALDHHRLAERETVDLAVKLERVAGQDLGVAIEALRPELVEGSVDRELLHGLERDLRTGSRRRHREARRHRAGRAGLGDQHQVGDRRRRGRGMVVDQCSQAAQALPLGRGGEVRLVGECVDVLAEHMARARERPRDLPAPVGDRRARPAVLLDLGAGALDRLPEREPVGEPDPQLLEVGRRVGVDVLESPQPGAVPPRDVAAAGHPVRPPCRTRL